MKIYLLAVLSLLLSIFAPPGAPYFASARTSTGSDFEIVDTYIASEMKAQRIPGLALGIVKDDRILYVKGYGRADLSGRQVSPSTPFVIGSTTKSFTALAVMQLVEAGKIDLDAPVQRYIPSFRVKGPKTSSTNTPSTGASSGDITSAITVRHLLNQTSGLSQYAAFQTMTWTDRSDDALEKHVRFLEGVQLNHPPGQSYEYSNANYITLGLIVQRVSGQSYETYVKEHIFPPLSMDNSFVSQEEALQNGMAMGHRWWFGFPIAVTLPYNRGDLPAGFIISNAEDMSHFLIAQLNGGRYGHNSVLSSAGVTLMHTEPVPGTYAMGWFSDEVSGIPVLGHEGGTFNFQTHMWLVPEQHLGVVVLANVISLIDPFSSADGVTTRRLASGVLSLVANRPLPDQGLGIGRLYWIVDGAIFLLTVWMVISLARVPKRYERLSQRGISGRFGLVWHITIVFLLHFVWPGAVLLTAASGVPQWQVTAMMQPDLTTWLMMMAVVVLLKGAFEIWLLLIRWSRSSGLL